MTTALANMPEMVGTELTAEEQATLEQCESIIGKNMLSVVEFGKALATIRDLKLYRAGYETWEEYVANRWDIKARTSYQYITAADVFENVRSCAQIEILPTNEFQLRQLARLDEQHQVDAWKQAVKKADDGKITARHVSMVVSDMLGEQIRSKAAAQQSQVRTSTYLPEDMKKLCWDLIEKVREARINNMPKSVKNDLKKRLQGVLQLLED